ncbi:hypothetical protein BD749_1733 [Pontibacter ramchanderi]|uniref:Uncharacterized protein n=1 Tax=Pontibacter ramchanderi TaxID=1179743 RepID=A0A2N3UB55_9BACT|nr:hypothetical protein BD749_1733 [Pontibacter ramchanderi]
MPFNALRTTMTLYLRLGLHRSQLKNRLHTSCYDALNWTQVKACLYYISI